MLILDREHRTHNGMNFTKSVKNPNSRIARLVRYLNENGPTSKRKILAELFDREMRDNTPYVPNSNTVTRGWGWYMWSLGLHYDIIRKTRVGNRVLYSVGVNYNEVVR
jgi:hypothetical protein